MIFLQSFMFFGINDVTLDSKKTEITMNIK